VTTELIIKLLQSLFPELSLEQVLAMARERLTGKLTQAEVDAFLTLQHEARRVAKEV
jgi:hypothetical protein